MGARREVRDERGPDPLAVEPPSGGGRGDAHAIALDHEARVGRLALEAAEPR